MSKIPEVTFGKPHQLGDGETETPIYFGEDEVGSILKTTIPNPLFGRMAEWYREYVAGEYEVTWVIDREDKSFDVSDYPTGARGALAAAKAYARSVIL